MDFSVSDDHRAIREGVGAVVRSFDDAYWLARDDDGEFPREFHRAMADAGWLGITMPQEYGGAGLGVTEAVIMLHEVASHGGGMAAASTVHINLFGPHPIVVFGTPEQRQRWLPRLVEGKDQCCFGFTEPDAGLNTTAIKTFAQKVPGGYRVHGQKVWTSTAQVASKVMLLTRTTKLEDCARPTDGITIFYTDLDRSKIDVHRIREDGPQGGRLERDLHRRPVHPGERPDRRRGQGLLVHPAQPEPGAPAGRRRGDRDRPGRAAPRREVRARARRVRPPDRPEPGHPASARRALDGARGGLGDDDEGRLAVRPASSRAGPRRTPRSSSARAPATTPACRRC